MKHVVAAQRPHREPSVALGLPELRIAHLPEDHQEAVAAPTYVAEREGGGEARAREGPAVCVEVCTELLDHRPAAARAQLLEVEDDHLGRMAAYERPDLIAEEI